MADTSRQAPSNTKRIRRAIEATTNEVEAAQELQNTTMIRFRKCVIKSAAFAAAKMATRSAITTPKI